MRKLKFYKESDNRWYVDLPDWNGSKAELEMVSGADIMLEYMAEGENHVWITLSEEYFENSDKLEFIRIATEIDNGAFYKLNKYRGAESKYDINEAIRLVIDQYAVTNFNNFLRGK